MIPGKKSTKKRKNAKVKKCFCVLRKHLFSKKKQRKKRLQKKRSGYKKKRKNAKVKKCFCVFRKHLFSKNNGSSGYEKKDNK